MLLWLATVLKARVCVERFFLVGGTAHVLADRVNTCKKLVAHVLADRVNTCKKLVAYVLAAWLNSYNRGGAHAMANRVNA